MRDSNSILTVTHAVLINEEDSPKAVVCTGTRTEGREHNYTHYVKDMVDTTHDNGDATLGHAVTISTVKGD